MSASMPWFRMYVDFLTDPKMISLAFEDQRHFIGLLALKSDGALDSNCDPDLLDRIVAQRLWIDHGVIRDVKKRLINANLIDGNWQPIAWDRRQFKSDSSKERVRAFRERAKNGNAPRNDDETLQKQSGNGLDTDTDTDKEEAKASLSASKLPACPHIEILGLFAKHLPELPQPKPELWEGQRAKNLAARWKWCLTTKSSKTQEFYATDKASALAWFDRFFGYVAKSDFLTGRNGQWTSCDLAWLTKAENFAKVLQGNYENKVAA